MSRKDITFDSRLFCNEDPATPGMRQADAVKDYSSGKEQTLIINPVRVENEPEVVSTMFRVQGESSYTVPALLPTDPAARKDIPICTGVRGDRGMNKPCLRGHTSPRRKRRCVECAREDDRKRYHASDKQKNAARLRMRKGLPVPTHPCPVGCELCGRIPKDGQRALSLDHDHKTGRFRGWLCGGCNRSLGTLGDDIQGLQKAAVYLQKSTTVLPTDAKERKKIPLCTGLFDYFPAALAEVAKVSKQGNDQHNPGEPLHWARGKSMDQADTIVRHLMERGTIDTDGMRHTAKAAWRVLALLQLELEEAGAPLARGAW